jgi:hypothetical protein
VERGRRPARSNGRKTGDGFVDGGRGARKTAGSARCRPSGRRRSRASSSRCCDSLHGCPAPAGLPGVSCTRCSVIRFDSAVQFFPTDSPSPAPYLIRSIIFFACREQARGQQEGHEHSGVVLIPTKFESIGVAHDACVVDLGLLAGFKANND